MTAARRRSPAEMCTRPNFSTMSSHWVPLPDAGAPAMTTLFGPAAASDTIDLRLAEVARTEERAANFLVALPLANCVVVAGAADADMENDMVCGRS